MITASGTADEGTINTGVRKYNDARGRTGRVQHNPTRVRVLLRAHAARIDPRKCRNHRFCGCERASQKGEQVVAYIVCSPELDPFTNCTNDQSSLETLFLLLLFLFFFLPFTPSVIFTLFFLSLSPSLDVNSDPGSPSRLCSPLPTTVRAFDFYRDKTAALFLPSSTPIELRLHTWTMFTLFFSPWNTYYKG